MSAVSSRHPFSPRLQGNGVSKGIALGPVFILRDSSPINEKAFQGTDTELARFTDAHTLVSTKLKATVEKTKKEVGTEEAEIFEAHLMMIQDEELVQPIKAGILNESLNAESAIKAAFELHIQVFEASDSDYMRERALDLKDLRSQLIQALHPEINSGIESIRTPVILVAQDLTPSQTIALNRDLIQGILTEEGGETSHSAIIARTLGIPCISGITEIRSILSPGLEIAFDGKEGTLFDGIDEKMRRYFQALIESQHSEKHLLQEFVGKKTLTRDLHSLTLMGNIGGAKDTKAALAADVEGVGLFRTEFLFMERSTAPSLEEQRLAYQEVLSTLAPSEVVIRTLDVGGDKPIDYIQIRKEENPFLGVRAIRYCLKDLTLFKTQIKALLLANEWGNLSIMTPMVSHADQARQVKLLIEECHEELLQDSRYLKKPFRIGTMVEIPSLIFEMKELKKSVSFVSVGTNDLMQYALAVDRMNPDLQELYSPYHLGFIRMMKLLADEGKRHEIQLGICGELGGKDEFIPLWIAMGYTKLSMTPNEVLIKRRLISKLSTLECDALLEDILESQDADEVRMKLTHFHQRMIQS